MVTSVRLNQCASVVRPFKDARGAGSRVEDPSEIIPGDSATQTDLAELNEGGRVTFYTLENCQGVLLPENKSSAAKIPESNVNCWVPILGSTLKRGMYVSSCKSTGVSYDSYLVSNKLNARPIFAF